MVKHSYIFIAIFGGMGANVLSETLSKQTNRQQQNRPELVRLSLLFSVWKFQEIWSLRFITSYV